MLTSLIQDGYVESVCTNSSQCNVPKDSLGLLNHSGFRESQTLHVATQRVSAHFLSMNCICNALPEAPGWLPCIDGAPFSSILSHLQLKVPYSLCRLSKHKGKSSIHRFWFLLTQCYCEFHPESHLLSSAIRLMPPGALLQADFSISRASSTCASPVGSTSFFAASLHT